MVHITSVLCRFVDLTRNVAAENILWIILAASVGTIYFLRFSPKLPLPPSPPTNILSGNVRQMPQTEPWKAFGEWSKLYGSPLVSFRVYNRRTVVLNTYKAAADLLDVRSSIYSDRPFTWFYGELVGRKMNVFQMSSQNPRFKVYRRTLNSGLNPRAVQGYRDLQVQEVHVLLRGLATSPEDFLAHLRRNAGAVVLKLAYGWNVEGNDDYFVSLMEEAFQISAQIVKPGGWLVDAIPILRFVPSWFPGARFKRQAAEAREHFSKIDSVPHMWAKNQIESGHYTESFTSQHLKREDGRPLTSDEEDIVKWCTAALYAGGADTTVAAMTTFILRMALHPHVQQRAQKEVDDVIGKDRLPEPADEKRLPYVTALIKEILRISPVAPLGLTHRVTQDDEYLGYCIPKGASIVPNIWAMMHNPELYPDPMVFSPDRFMEPLNQMDPRKVAFGFGRRVCPGAYFAETAMFLNICSILSVFTILKPLNENGKEVDPLVEYTTGITSHAKPFHCRIVPRAASPLLSHVINS